MSESNNLILGPDGKPLQLRPKRNWLTFSDQLFRHPVFVALLTLLIGSVILKSWSDAKIKREINTGLAVKFLEDVGNSINSTLSKLFSQIRDPANQSTNDNANFAKSREALYEMRLVVKMKAGSLLKDPEFSKAFDEIVFEITDIGDQISALRDGKPEASIATNIQSKTLSCESRWNIKSKKANLPPPFDNYYSWASCIWVYTDALLSTHLQQLTKTE